LENFKLPLESAKLGLTWEVFKIFGLNWKETGSGTRPAGKEMQNAKLAEALRTEKVKFTYQEWTTFEVLDLSYDSYIKVGGCFFQPIGKEDGLEGLQK